MSAPSPAALRPRGVKQTSERLGASLRENTDQGLRVRGIKRRASLFNIDRIDHLYQDCMPSTSASRCPRICRSTIEHAALAHAD